MPTGTRIAFTSGPAYQDHNRIWAALDKVLGKYPDMVQRPLPNNLHWSGVEQSCLELVVKVQIVELEFGFFVVLGKHRWGLEQCFRCLFSKCGHPFHSFGRGRDHGGPTPLEDFIGDHHKPKIRRNVSFLLQIGLDCVRIDIDRRLDCLMPIVKTYGFCQARPRHLNTSRRRFGPSQSECRLKSWKRGMMRAVFNIWRNMAHNECTEIIEQREEVGRPDGSNFHGFGVFTSLCRAEQKQTVLRMLFELRMGKFELRLGQQKQFGFTHHPAPRHLAMTQKRGRSGVGSAPLGHRFRPTRPTNSR
ncbi:MAG: SLOG family protein [Novosphingobium sp.]